jgi:toxin YhaV
LAVESARSQGAEGFESNANVKLFNALADLIFERVPTDPNRTDYRQGNTLGLPFRHWRRAKVGRRFHLFFRFDSRSQIIIYAWVNDAQTLRSAGSDTDPYAVFQRMLRSEAPPDDWESLLCASKTD